MRAFPAPPASRSIALPLLPGDVRRRTHGPAVTLATGGSAQVASEPLQDMLEPTVLKPLAAPPTVRHGGGWSAGLCLLYAMGVALLTGGLCLALPPVQQREFGDAVRVEEDAICFRASREGSYAVAEVALGAPMHVLRLLVLPHLEDRAPDASGWERVADGWAG